jgi:uncharacterized SAM-binding protein YcdF (DUF218 family)
VRRAARILYHAAAVLGFMMVVVTATPLLRWWISMLDRPWRAPGGDVLIVLAADALEDGTVGEFSYWRAVYSVWAWQEGNFREVWVSGGGNVPEAISHFLVARGVPEARIHLEAGSSSTRESAVHMSSLLAGSPGTKVLLTSDFHIYRARRAFEKAGLTVEPRPVPDAGKRLERWSLRWGVFEELIVEEVKIAGYRARGWI